MPRLPDEHNNETSTLPSTSLLFRALLKKRWLDPDSDAILPDAYIPRSNGRDDEGLSVTIADSALETELQKEAHAVASSFNRVFGVALLIAGEVRDIDDCLDVVRDPLDGVPNHALLTGIPRQEFDPAKAERLAGQLARISQKIL